jgi:hypothetical protein
MLSSSEARGPWRGFSRDQMLCGYLLTDIEVSRPQRKVCLGRWYHGRIVQSLPSPKDGAGGRCSLQITSEASFLGPKNYIWWYRGLNSESKGLTYARKVLYLATLPALLALIIFDTESSFMPRPAWTTILLISTSQETQCELPCPAKTDIFYTAGRSVNWNFKTLLLKNF